MSTFTAPLVVEITQAKVRGRTVAKLLRGFVYYRSATDLIEVPAGFETDFASVPRVLWSLFPPIGLYAKAAVVHDYLYVTHAVDRRTADDILLEACEALGVPMLTRKLLYLAVRIFGAAGWRRKGRP